MNIDTQFSLLVSDLIYDIVEEGCISEDKETPIIEVLSLFLEEHKNFNLESWFKIASLVFTCEYVKCFNTTINTLLNNIKILIIQNIVDVQEAITSIPVPSPNNMRFNRYISQEEEQ